MTGEIGRIIIKELNEKTFLSFFGLLIIAKCHVFEGLLGFLKCIGLGVLLLELCKLLRILCNLTREHVICQRPRLELDCHAASGCVAKKETQLSLDVHIFSSSEEKYGPKPRASQVSRLFLNVFLSFSMHLE